MVKILSFDVGIKNLAYCLVEFAETKNTILDWGIIDIMATFLDKTTKCSVVKNGAECGATAIVCIRLPDKTIGFCKKKTCQKVVQTAYQPKQIKKIKAVTTKTVSLLHLTSELIRQLKLYKVFLTADIVVIENQPVLKNPTMKSIQMVLYTFFLVNGITEDAPLTNIALFNAGRKLDIYDGPEITTPCKKGTYADRKYLSIEMTKYLLRDIPDKLQFFSTHKKQDDLADSYLQCLTFYKKRHNA
jgi:hypothetical protein